MKSSQVKARKKIKNLARRLKEYEKHTTDSGYRKPGSMNK